MKKTLSMPLTLEISILILTSCLALVLFSIDIMCSMHFLAGMPYIATLLLTLPLRQPKWTKFFAGFSTGLVLTGYLLYFMNSPSLPFFISQFVTHELANRGIGVLMLWTLTFLIIHYQHIVHELKISEHKYRSILSASLDPIVIFDGQGKIQLASYSIEGVFGWSDKSTISMNIKELFSQDSQRDFTNISKPSTSGQDNEVIGKHKNGIEFPCEFSINEVLLPDTTDPYYIAILRDISYRKKTEAQLIWISNHDELTGIYNRRHFNQQVDIEWRRMQRNKTPLGIILLDIDQFKLYNDTLGHQAGDNCLKLVASVLPKCLNRPSDFAARYGGEEFVILLPNTDPEGTQRVGMNILEKIRAMNIPHPVSTVQDNVTVSLGMSCLIPERSSKYEVLIRQADYALYQAKDTGRNKAIFFKED